MQPKISVIVPVYKVEKYIRKCIDSLLNQTYKNLEIIIIDDGSPDGCPEICNEYSQKYSCIKTYHKLNGGLSSARNYGVEKTECEWIAFVDSDDYVEQTYIEDLWNLREKFKAEMSITRVVRENEDGSGRPAFISVFEERCVDKKNAIFEVYKAELVGWSAYGKLYKREHLVKYPFPDGYYEDCACMYRILGECEKIAIGNYEKNYHYINRQGSILQSDLKKEHFRIFDICKEFEVYIQENYPDLNILTVLFFRFAVTQMLNCQSMTEDEYNKIYRMYRSIFRSNLKMVLSDHRISNSQKAFMILHCLTPSIFRLQREVLLLIKKRRVDK